MSLLNLMSKLAYHLCYHVLKVMIFVINFRGRVKIQSRSQEVLDRGNSLLGAGQLIDALSQYNSAIGK